MPLSELSPGHVGRNGLVGEPTGSSRECNRSSTDPNIGAYTGLSKTPSSIQSMLKNTTETGDVGQFSIKPARAPSIMYRTPKSPGTAQSIQSKKRHVVGRYREQRDGGRNSRHPSSAHALVVDTSYRSHSQRSYHDARSGSTGAEEDERSYSMTQKSITSQSFSHRPSPTGFHIHDQEDFRGMRPRSPFAYPTRLKRPGYRPSSPALSDYNRPGMGTYIGPSRAASFRTSSPLSIYTPQRIPSAWQQHLNRSDPVPRYYAPSPRQEDYGETIASSIPGPLSQLSNGFVPARSSTPTQSSNVSVSHQPSPSPSPAFYDYTESFEESHYHSVSMSSFSLAEQAIPEDASKVYYELEGNAPSPLIAELTAHSDFPSGLSQNYAQELPEQVLSTKIARKAVPSFRGTEQHTKPTSEAATTIKERDSQMDDRDNGRETETKTTHMDHLESPVSGNIPKAGLVPVLKPPFDHVAPPEHSHGPSASNASLKSISLSSSSSESVYSLQSSSRKDRQAPVQGLTGPSDTVFPSPPYLEIPLVQPSNSTMTAQNVKSHAACLPRSRSLDGKSDTTEHTEIYAPTPERAASSLSNRNRFSRILYLDEDSADVDKLTAKATAETGPYNQHYTKNTRAASSSTPADQFEHDNGHSHHTLGGGAKSPQPNANGADPESAIRVSEISKGSLRLPAMRIPRRSSSRLLLTAMSDNTAEPTIPPRRSSYTRKPAYQMFEQASRSVSGLPAVTEDLDKSTGPNQETVLKNFTVPRTMKELAALTEDLDESTAPGQVTLLESNNVPRTMKKLPPLPREPTLVAYSPPVDHAPSALPFAFQPLGGDFKTEIPSLDVESPGVPKPKQTVEVPSSLVELSAVASSEQSIDVSATHDENNTTIHPKRSIEIQGDQLEPTDPSHAKQQDGMPTARPDSIAESTSKQSPVIPATVLEPTRISNSAISSSRLSESDDEAQAPISKYKLKMRGYRDSPPSLQPWNLDASYPWVGQSPELEVIMPQDSEDPPEQPSSAMPRFKLKLHQSSSSIAGTTKITKLRRSLETPLKASIDVSNDLFQGSGFGRGPRPSCTIGQENSSQSPHLQTRFQESFEQPIATFAISPTIMLVPPSPSLNLEARSFFSDDSSQTRNKSSLRKRLSQLRAMASRNTMSEDGRSFDRGILRSRASGRISKQSHRTAEGVPHSKSVRSKVADKVKEWLLRGGEKVRELWRSRMASGPADLYVAD